jgi:hypothetical protein
MPLSRALGSTSGYGGTAPRSAAYDPASIFSPRRDGQRSSIRCSCNDAFSAPTSSRVSGPRRVMFPPGYRRGGAARFSTHPRLLSPVRLHGMLVARRSRRGRGARRANVSARREALDLATPSIGSRAEGTAGNHRRQVYGQRRPAAGGAGYPSTEQHFLFWSMFSWRLLKVSPEQATTRKR